MDKALIKYKKLIYGIFALLSVIFLYENIQFKKNVGAKYNEGQRYTLIQKKGKSQQVFSHSLPWKITLAQWNNWQGIIKVSGNEARNTRLFYIDNVWAFFLVLCIYLFGVMGRETVPWHKRVLFPLLLGAYFFDLLENLSYLAYISWMTHIPLLSNVKIGFYLVGIIWAIYMRCRK